MLAPNPTQNKIKQKTKNLKRLAIGWLWVSHSADIPSYNTNELPGAVLHSSPDHPPVQAQEGAFFFVPAV